MVQQPDPSTAEQPNADFSILNQIVELDIDLASRSLRGSTTLLVSPHSSDLKAIRLNCRQCILTKLLVNDRVSTGTLYEEPYAKTQLSYSATVQQYDQYRERLEKQIKEPPEPELTIKLGKHVKIERQSSLFEDAQSSPLKKNLGVVKQEPSDASAIDFAQGTRKEFEGKEAFAPITVLIEYIIPYLRDGLHFVGWEEDDLRHPHVFTTISQLPGSACCLFPCVDQLNSRHSWEIRITCARTIGDAFKRTAGRTPAQSSHGAQALGAQQASQEEIQNNFGNEDKALDLIVVCTGNLTDEIIDSKDSRRKTSVFSCDTALSPQQIGFAIGPFESVDLVRFREGGEDERLGHNARPVNGFCLPGRSSEVENTCFPLAKAIDFFTTNYNVYPFSEYKVCFVEDINPSIIHSASLSICSSHLLFPEDVLDPLDKVTRQMIHALASQWMGVYIIPKEPEDTWVVVGMAYYMTDVFIRKLSGNNEYRFNQKKASDLVVELDVDRPSLRDLGALIHLDPLELNFMSLKAPLVLFILDQRLKKSGHSGMARIITKILLNSRQSDIEDFQGIQITHAYFVKMCERITHLKLQSFFEQWVEGTGCPKFRVQQRFNKKKLVVEMSIHQVQADNVQSKDLHPKTFVRSVKEEARKVKPTSIQPVFTGPMTIRIHEADGTPYEHIIEIKEGSTRFDVPYNTKYKRLKRTKRQKEKALTAAGVEYAGDGSDDVLLYSLGDVLQSEEEVKEWRLQEWSADDEDRMSQESYEWIRMDADFEWICKISLQMPPYMWVSQLQQDRDVVAQLETIQYLANQNGHPLISSICIRTLMDHRYFYGIRVAAASVLTKCARDETNWIGLHHLEKAYQELFCYTDSPMPRRNDFSDRTSYYMQCAIPRAISKVRDNNGRATPRVQSFLLDKLKFNDNSNNSFSDGHYLALLMRALAEAIATSPPHTMTDIDETDLSSDFEDPRFHTACLEEIERYRRVDEWIPSYHNILSTTALDCKRILTEARIIDLEPRDFLQYTSHDTSDLLLLSAFSNLLQLGTIRNDAIVRWFFYILGHDPSPYIRAHMITILGRALGALAIGTGPSASINSKSNPTPVDSAADSDAMKNSGTLASTRGDAENDGLIIEQEDSNAPLARAALLARKQSVSGAKAALKEELSKYVPFQKALWDAIISPILNFSQIKELLDICEWLYTPELGAIVKLRYPRYWHVQRTGKGKLRFFQIEKFRTERIKEIWLPTASRSTVSLPAASSATAAAGTIGAPPSRPTHPGMPPHTNSQTIVLKLGNRKLSLSSSGTNVVANSPNSHSPISNKSSSSSTPVTAPRSMSMSMPRPPGIKREHSSPVVPSLSSSGPRQILKPPKRLTLSSVASDESLESMANSMKGTKGSNGSISSTGGERKASMSTGSGGGGGRKASMSSVSGTIGGSTLVGDGKSTAGSVSSGQGEVENPIKPKLTLKLKSGGGSGSPSS